MDGWVGGWVGRWRAAPACARCAVGTACGDRNATRRLLEHPRPPRHPPSQPSLPLPAARPSQPTVVLGDELEEEVLWVGEGGVSGGHVRAEKAVCQLHILCVCAHVCVCVCVCVHTGGGAPWHISVGGKRGQQQQRQPNTQRRPLARSVRPGSLPTSRVEASSCAATLGIPPPACRTTTATNTRPNTHLQGPPPGHKVFQDVSQAIEHRPRVPRVLVIPLAELPILRGRGRSGRTSQAGS